MTPREARRGLGGLVWATGSRGQPWGTAQGPRAAGCLHVGKGAGWLPGRTAAASSTERHGRVYFKNNRNLKKRELCADQVPREGLTVSLRETTRTITARKSLRVKWTEANFGLFLLDRLISLSEKRDNAPACTGGGSQGLVPGPQDQRQPLPRQSPWGPPAFHCQRRKEHSRTRHRPVGREG